jgi:hypothetical protein
MRKFGQLKGSARRGGFAEFSILHIMNEISGTVEKLSGREVWRRKSRGR